MMIDINLPESAASVLRAVFVEGGLWQFEPGTMTPPGGTVDCLIEMGLLAAGGGAVWLTGVGRQAAQQLMAEAGHETLVAGRSGP